MKTATSPCVVEKTFLWFTWTVIHHKYKLFEITKFMFCSKDFIVKKQCSGCGHIIEQSFVSYNELLLKGIPSEILNNISDSRPSQPIENNL